MRVVELSSPASSAGVVPASSGARTQAELARLLSVTQPTVRRMATGQRYDRRERQEDGTTERLGR